MTREEAIKYLRQIYPNGGHCWLDSQRIEAIDMAIMALSQPSLPSNLVEAAEKVNKRGLIGFEGCCWLTKEMPKDYFKAGAKWMAEQGVAADFEVNKLAVRAWLTAVDEDKFQKDIYDNFEAGDKVIVQIRK